MNYGSSLDGRGWPEFRRLLAVERRSFLKVGVLRMAGLLATMYRHLGVDTKVQYEDHLDRPHPVLPSGNPIEELFSR